jgi:hypothetical protein
MNATDRARLWRVSRALVVAAAVMGPQPAWAIETNPFLPPAERGDDMEARLQKRIDRAVAAAEERLVKTVVDALSGRDVSGAPKPLQDAVARRPPPPASPPASTNTSLPPGLPGLPALPSFLDGSSAAPPSSGAPVGVASSGPEPVPSGAVFIGCLDGQAFFQDRAGSPFLVDPRAFPPSSGGAGACGR